VDNSLISMSCTTHNGMLQYKVHNLYSSPNIIKVITSRMVNVVHIGAEKCMHNFSQKT
jgi:hypothetical protein